MATNNEDQEPDACVVEYTQDQVILVSINGTHGLRFSPLENGRLLAEWMPPSTSQPPDTRGHIATVERGGRVTWQDVTGDEAGAVCTRCGTPRQEGEMDDLVRTPAGELECGPRYRDVCYTLAAADQGCTCSRCYPEV